MDEDTSGIEFGDLPDILDEVARQHEDEIPLRRVFDGYCGHDKAAINEPMRSLTCRACQAQLDPFEFLVRLARDVDRWVTARRDVERRAREAAARLEAILREERNARARVARLKRRLPDE